VVVPNFFLWGIFLRFITFPFPVFPFSFCNLLFWFASLQKFGGAQKSGGIFGDGLFLKPPGFWEKRF